MGLTGTTEKGTVVIGVMIMVADVTDGMTMTEGATADMSLATMIKGMNAITITIAIVTIETTNPLWSRYVLTKASL